MAQIDTAASDAPTTPMVRISLFCLLAIWSAYLIWIWLPYARFPLSVFVGLSWDEYQYLPHIAALQADLRQGAFASFFGFQDTTFGYGALFWQLYAIASLPFRHWLLKGDGE